jgi:hypothetical protein
MIPRILIPSLMIIVLFIGLPTLGAADEDLCCCTTAALSVFGLFRDDCLLDGEQHDDCGTCQAWYSVTLYTYYCFETPRCFNIPCWHNVMFWGETRWQIGPVDSTNCELNPEPIGCECALQSCYCLDWTVIECNPDNCKASNNIDCYCPPL